MLTASIVTYQNKPETLLKTIESFLTSSKNSRLYVIDNSPTDAARNICQHPAVEYIFNNSNVGYGRAHNQALQKVYQSSKYHLVLNPDIFFNPNVVPELLNFMELNTEVGLTMPKILYPDGRLQRLCKLLPKPHQIIARRFLCKFKSLQEQINYTYEMKFTDYETITEVPSLSGSFMLIRTEALKKIGMFDERFFLYFEDTDLSRRIHEHYKTIYYPKVQIYHVHERSHSRDRKILMHGMRSAIQYFNKWGWVFDSKRDSVNKAAFTKHKLNGYSWALQS